MEPRTFATFIHGLTRAGLGAVLVADLEELAGAAFTSVAWRGEVEAIHHFPKIWADKKVGHSMVGTDILQYQPRIDRAGTGVKWYFLWAIRGLMHFLKNGYGKSYVSYSQLDLITECNRGNQLFSSPVPLKMVILNLFIWFAWH